MRSQALTRFLGLSFALMVIMSCLSKQASIFIGQFTHLRHFSPKIGTTCLLKFFLALTVHCPPTGAENIRFSKICFDLTSGGAGALRHNQLGVAREFYQVFIEADRLKDQLKREALPATTLHDLDLKRLTQLMVNDRTDRSVRFNNESFENRLYMELSNPIADLDQIKDRQSVIKELRENRSFRDSYENLIRAIQGLNLFAEGVFSDRSYPQRIRLRSSHPLAAFFKFLSTLNSHSYRTYGELFIPENSTKGLSLFLAEDRELKSLLGFSKEDPRYNQKFAAMDAALADFLNELNQLRHPELIRLASVFNYFVNPSLIEGDQEKLRFIDHFWGNRKEWVSEYNLNIQTESRALALFAGIYALKELEFFLFLSRDSKVNMSLPNFVESAQSYLEIENGHHPKLVAEGANSVPNSAQLGGEDQIRIQAIVGPNFRGKSKYKQMLGINVLFARIGSLVFAERMSLSLITPLTSFESNIGTRRNNDSLFSGKCRSAFCMLNSLEESEGRQYLFLMDEIFYGTDPVQQLAVSVTWTKRVARTHHIGVITAQDHDFHHWLEHEHSSDRMLSVQRLHNTRDYRIEYGSATEYDTNATEVVGEVGFDADFVNETSEAIDWIRRNRTRTTWTDE